MLNDAKELDILEVISLEPAVIEASRASVKNEMVDGALTNV